MARKPQGPLIYVWVAMILAALGIGASSVFDRGSTDTPQTVIATTVSGRTDTLYNVVPIDIKVCRDYPQNAPEVLAGNCYETRSTMDRDRRVNHPGRLIFAALLGLAALAGFVGLLDRFIPGRKDTPVIGTRPIGTWRCQSCGSLNDGSSPTCGRCGKDFGSIPDASGGPPTEQRNNPRGK